MNKNSFLAPVRSMLGEYLSLSPFIKETDVCFAKLKKELPWLSAPRKWVVGMMVCLDIYDVTNELWQVDQRTLQKRHLPGERNPVSASLL